MKLTALAAKRALALSLATLAGTAAPISGTGLALLAFTPTASARPPIAPAAPDDAAKLPIKRITLYRSGVGYFERRTSVEGNADVQLRFATEQINDILKSMVLLDLDGGRIGSVSYGSKEPLERRLASFGVDISDDPPAGKILARLRGSPVRLTTPEGDVSGTIMNVENRPTIVGGTGQSPPAKHDLPWINLVTPTGVRSINLTEVTGFQLLDPVLAEELGKALAALAEHRADRVKTVDLNLRGEGQRDVLVAYVHEMPVWKASYRLVLPDPSEGGNGASKPTIQGWAIVENTTDEDWNGVTLSLVAGRPVSFQMDLYEPLHVWRPEIPVPTVPGVLPRTYGAAQGSGALEDRRAERDAAAFQSRGVPEASPAPAAGARMRAKSVEGDAAVGFAGRAMSEALAGSAAAEGESIGEVFQFTLTDPVTIERQRSAMLPIVGTQIEGRRVSIYNAADNSEYAMRGVELKNTTGNPLMPGPIAVFDGAAYAGDAQIGHVTTGDTRLLAYSIDLDVTARTESKPTQTLQKVRIVSGMIEQTLKHQQATTYTLTNKDTVRPRTILVEHARAAGWTLTKPAKPTEETKDLYRFELPLAPGKGGSLEVVQEITQAERIQVTSFPIDTLIAWSQQGKVSQKVLDAAKEAARLQGEINAAQQRLAQLDAETTQISQDQERIRGNMGAIDRNGDLYRRYVSKLNEQESRLEAIRTEREASQQLANKTRAQLDSFIRDLNVD